MLTAAECLKLATECEEMAGDRALAEYRRTLLELADLWRTAAVARRVKA